ncbi:sigma 54-interacting transcriptional regulator, partial [candidate division KSB1 bacterium]|nr:sigma 54-interacting transcriptional regulator [candidate division KSB1 bacterium]
MKNPDNAQILSEEIQRLKQTVNEITILNDISNAISSTMDLQEIMAKIITRSLYAFGVEQGTIMLLEENSAEPMRTIIRGVSDRYRGKIYKLGIQLTGWMIKNRRPLLINNPKDDERLKGLKLEENSINSILCIPMIFRGKLIGVINLFNKKQGDFTNDDQKLMCIIASQVASFLVNALSFEIVKETNEVLQKQTTSLQQEVGARYGFSGIIGKSTKIRDILKDLESIAQSSASVLITGETGTGKELIAKTIHYNSQRKDKPFVDVNSAALPENLVESEFFGIEAGVATGVTKRIGLFEQANGGTLFIDEIGDMSL